MSESPERVGPPLDRAFRRLIDGAPLHLWMSDPSGRTIWASDSWLAFGGRDSAAELLASWESRVRPEDVRRTLATFRNAVEQRESFVSEYRIRRADGAWRTVLTRGVPYTDGDGAYAGHIGVTHDITELRGATAVARASFEQQREILDRLRMGIFAVDRQGRYRYVNRAWEDVFHLRREQVIGRTLADFFPADIAAVMTADNLWLLDHPDADVEREMHVASAAGPVDVFVRKLRVIDSDGMTPLVYGVVTDIRQLKQAEEQRRQFAERMQQSQHLESLGVLAGGVAHDFNNLLVGVMGNAELAREHAPEGSRLREMIERILSSAERAAELSGRMLAYSGHGVTPAETLDLTQLVAQMTALLRGSTPGNATLEIASGPGDAIVHGDATHLRQIIVNLVTNAFEALGGEAGTVRVRTGSAEFTREELDACTLGADRAPGRYAVLEVSDAGPGMDESTLARVFDPFFSTKFTGRGLGLPVVLGIARAHRGAVTVDSGPERGTSVRVLFPWAGVAPARTSAPEAQPAPAHGRVILVVDDEPAVREVVKAALGRDGHEVRLARDGREGLELWRSERDSIGLVVADLTMPDMTGDDMLMTLRELGATMPAILMSGFDANFDDSVRARAGIAHFLEKPFTMARLREQVRIALEGAED